MSNSACKKCGGEHHTEDHWKHKERTQDGEKLLRTPGAIGYERDLDDPFHPDYEPPHDPAWCYTCNRDTAFCECICYSCYEHLDDCACTCALCGVHCPGGGLCEEHKKTWDIDVQGPIPNTGEAKACSGCGIIFNTIWEYGPDVGPYKCKRQHTRNVCISCHNRHAT